jgi:hypothetical protein
VLHHLVEIVLQHLRNLADRCAQFVVDVSVSEQLLQFVNQFR